MARMVPRAEQDQRVVEQQAPSLHAELAQRESPVKISLFIPGRHKTTIRESSKRWPERLGDVAALGPDGLNFSVPMTTELGAEDPSTAAETVFEALNSGRFLAMHHTKTGYSRDGDQAERDGRLRPGAVGPGSIS